MKIFNSAYRDPAGTSVIGIRELPGTMPAFSTVFWPGALIKYTVNPAGNPASLSVDRAKRSLVKG